MTPQEFVVYLRVFHKNAIGHYRWPPTKSKASRTIPFVPQVGMCLVLDEDAWPDGDIIKEVKWCWGQDCFWIYVENDDTRETDCGDNCTCCGPYDKWLGFWELESVEKYNNV